MYNIFLNCESIDNNFILLIDIMLSINMRKILYATIMKGKKL